MLYFYEHMNNNNNTLDSIKLLLFNQMSVQRYLLEKTGVLIGSYICLLFDYQ